MPDSTEERVATVVSCAWWLAVRDESLARAMRDEFCHEWYVPEEVWNAEVNGLTEYSQRQGADTAALEALRLGGDDA